MQSKTPKPSHQNRHHQQPQKEVNFKEAPVDIIDGPVVIADKDIPIKSDKQQKEKSMFSFFKKKKSKVGRSFSK